MGGGGVPGGLCDAGPRQCGLCRRAPGRDGGDPARRTVWRLAAIAVAVPLVLAAAGPINHRLLGAGASGVERTQAMYDLSGIAVATDDTDTGLTRPEIATLRARACVRPFFWDPLGDGGRCGAETAKLRATSVGALYGTLARAVLHHPLAYAAHRLAHLNATDRWLVPLHWYGAAPPVANEPNPYDFRAPGKAAGRWQQLAGVLVEAPFGWPALWAVLAVIGLAATWRAEDAAGGLAAALFASAVGQEASFAVISIASDLRYHLWAMTATAIGWVVLGRMPRGRWAWGAVIVVLVGGIAARLWLPQAAQTYSGCSADRVQLRQRAIVGGAQGERCDGRRSRTDLQGFQGRGEHGARRTRTLPRHRRQQARRLEGRGRRGIGRERRPQIGKRIVAIKRKAKADLTDDDYAHMKKVVAYVRRHLAQGGPDKDKAHSDWRYSLMNWGHDPKNRVRRRPRRSSCARRVRGRLRR